MELIFKFLNYTIGSLVQIYQNRAQFELNKQILNDKLGNLFASNEAKENQLEDQILVQYDQQLKLEQTKKNLIAVAILIAIIIAGFIIAGLIRKKNE